MASVRKTASRRISGPPLLVVFLLVTLTLSLWLGYQALDAARSHRQTAEEVLDNYAGIAGWEYSRVTREGLASLLRGVFDDIPRTLRRQPPAPRIMVRDMQSALRSQGCRCSELRRLTWYFSVDFESGAVLAEPDTLPPALLERLAEKIIIDRDSVPGDRIRLFTVEGGELFGSPSVVAYHMTLNEDEQDRLAYGFVADADAFGELFSRWFQRTTLLPTSVATSQPNDSLMRISVRGPGGMVVFESPADYPWTFSATDTLESAYGSLVVEAAIRPEAASQLIIGGLPRSRLPLLAGLMLLTLGVGAAALTQIRREHQLKRLRDDFISGVSHEFRTPLAQICVFAELLADDKLKTEYERKRSTGIINREARRLTHLVENILSFSGARRRLLPVGDPEEVDLGTAVKELTEVFAPQAGERQARIETDVEPGLTVLADRGALHRILANLLDNALKYGPQGQTVRVHATMHEDMIRISLEDRGPGIPAGDQIRVWEPYRRLERDVASDVQGSGIGLAVVAELCSVYGGQAWVEEGEGGGSRFVVELPGKTRSTEHAAWEVGGS